MVALVEVHAVLRDLPHLSSLGIQVEMDHHLDVKWKPRELPVGIDEWETKNAPIHRECQVAGQTLAAGAGSSSSTSFPLLI
jgi:hypothetical protein